MAAFPATFGAVCPAAAAPMGGGLATIAGGLATRGAYKADLGGAPRRAIAKVTTGR